MASSAKVLFIGSVWPEPKSSAGGGRLMQLIRLFQANNFEVHYGSAATETDHSESMELIGVEGHSFVLNSSSFDAQIAALNPAVVIFDRYTSEEQYGWRVKEACPNAIRLIETIDLHCLRLTRQAMLKAGISAEYLEDELLKSEVAIREITSILRSDLSLLLSGEEMRILKKVFRVPECILFHLPFEVLPFKGEILSFEEREAYVTIGNFKHAPNYDSVKYLKEEIFPRIRALDKKAILKVYGSYMDQKSQQLHNPKHGFYVEGRAASVEEVVGEARVLLAPLRFGAGIKGKLLDALRMGTPSVSSSIGVEGMNEPHAWPTMVCEDPDTFARTANELYHNKESWLKAQKEGFTVLEQNFCKPEHEEQLVDLLNAMMSNPEKYRKANFIAPILWHQSHSASKFMSKWIEEKNKA